MPARTRSSPSVDEGGLVRRAKLQHPLSVRVRTAAHQQPPRLRRGPPPGPPQGEDAVWIFAPNDFMEPQQIDIVRLQALRRLYHTSQG